MGKVKYVENCTFGLVEAGTSSEYHLVVISYLCVFC